MDNNNFFEDELQWDDLEKLNDFEIELPEKKEVIINRTIIKRGVGYFVILLGCVFLLKAGYSFTVKSNLALIGTKTSPVLSRTQPVNSIIEKKQSVIAVKKPPLILPQGETQPMEIKEVVRVLPGNVVEHHTEAELLVSETEIHDGVMMILPNKLKRDAEYDITTPIVTIPKKTIIPTPPKIVELPVVASIVEPVIKGKKPASKVVRRKRQPVVALQPKPQPKKAEKIVERQIVIAEVEHKQVVPVAIEDREEKPVLPIVKVKKINILGEDKNVAN